MSRRIVRRALGRPLQRFVASLGIDRSPGELLLITGGGEWAVKQVALALQVELAPWYRAVKVLDFVGQRRFVSRANIHCLCRPAFFAGSGIPDVHASNRLVVSWLHGGLRSDDSELRAASHQLERHWRRVRRFIVPNRTTYENMLECGVDPAIIHVIPNGVDTRLFQPPASAGDRAAVRRRLELPEDAFVVGSFQRDGDDAGTPKLVKGPDILVETLIEARRHAPVVALLSGSGRVYVERRLAAAGVPYVRHWAEDLTELARLYHALDAYLVSSREEGGPTALRESMASGVPVVSTRMGLAADLIEQGANGLVAEVGDSPGLAKLLLGLVESETLRARIAEAALVTVRALDFRVIAARYHDEVYRQAFV